MKLNIVSPIQQTWTLMDILDKRPPRGWEKIFQSARPEIEDLQEDLEKDEQQYGCYYPEKKNLFRAFDLTPLDRVRVIIVGQDPYHNLTKTTREIRAQGLSFSVSKLSDIPPSLLNIFKELRSDIPEFVQPSHGDLSSWALQGVLLLNSCLTVLPNQPGSHKKIWNGVLYRIIEAIVDINNKAIFVLWGRKAQELKKMIRGRCPVLEAGHPSSMNAKGGFLGCKHFSQINTLLANVGSQPIDWNLH